MAAKIRPARHGTGGDPPGETGPFPGTQPPIIAEGNDSVYAQYTLLAEDRDALSQRLKAAGIPAVAYYTAPLHLQITHPVHYAGVG